VSALKYLFFTNIKNTIKDLKNHPAKLVLVIVFIVLFGFVIFAGNMDTPTPENMRDAHELYAGTFALYAFSFIMTAMAGFSSGASFYSMADISMLFMAPISSKKILIYGLIKQMGTSLWIGFFLFFQYAWLQNTYGLGVFGLFAIFVGYCITMFCAQLTAMTIYSFTSNNEKLKKQLKAAIIAICVIVLALILKDSLLPNSDKLKVIVDSANATWVSFVPVVGWLKACAVGIMTLNFANIALSLLAVTAYVIALVFLVARAKADFYEDVLQATEVSFSAITAKKEGKISDAPKNVKVGKTGINKGFGPNVFFYKHMLENRRSGMLFIDKNSLIFIAMCIFFALFMRETNSIIPAFVFATYMQVFTVAMGRWIRELTQPYIYMIPADPFKKLMCVAQENIFKIIVEAIILFIPIGLIIKAPVYEILICIVARIGFGVLFMSGNILIERVLGTLTSKTLIFFLYFIIMLLLAAPGFIFGFLLTARLAAIPETVTILLSSFIWNVAISALIIFLCRDILNYAELNNR